jgi:hypothetical protein
MASIIKEIELSVPADVAWRMLRDVGAVDKAFAPVLTDSRLDGAVRTVTFANGMVAQEQIVAIDDAHRRVAYAVVGGRFTHHNASMQVVDRGDGKSCVVWASDLLPDAAAGMVRELVEQGAKALQSNTARFA